jgi:NodT family efflux transporter outer membrane factor (OMF) lipoprotein
MSRLVATVCLTLAVAGCAIRTPIATPVVDTGTAFRNETASAASVLRDRWWTQLGDPRLDSLVDRAIAASPELQAVIARLQALEAELRVQLARRRPSVNALAEAERRKFPQGPVLQGGGALLDTGGDGPTIFNRYAIGLEASYEFDFWGGIAAGVRAARGDLEAERADLEVARRVLVANVVDAYLDAGAVRARLVLLEEQREVAGRIAALRRRQLAAGTSTRSEVNRADAEIGRITGGIQDARKLDAQAVVRLAVLVGESPTTSAIQLVSRPLPACPAIRAGIPASVLGARPDVRAATARLFAAGARFDEAEAARYPNVVFSASLGPTAPRTRDLDGNRALGWAWGPRLVLPVFDAGARKARAAAAQALIREREAQYRQTVLRALEEVEVALAGLAADDRALDARRTLLDLALTDLRQAETRRRAGREGVLPSLELQINRATAAAQTIEAEREKLRSWVALVRALGTGPTPDRETATP